MYKKIILIAILSMVTGLVILNLVKTKDIEVKKTQKQVNNTNMLTMMLKTEAGTGNYEETTASEWPQDGYIFNESLSRCENGGTLSWDDNAKKIILNTNVSDKCYVYFDKINPLIITNASLEINRDGYVIITEVITNPIVNISKYYLLLEDNDEYISTNLRDYNPDLTACVKAGDKITYSLYIIDENGNISDIYNSSFLAQVSVICGI